MTKRKTRETAKAKDKTPKWNAVKTRNLATITESEAIAMSETVLKAWRSYQAKEKIIAPVDREKYYKI